MAACPPSAWSSGTTTNRHITESPTFTLPVPAGATSLVVTVLAVDFTDNAGTAVNQMSVVDFGGTDLTGWANISLKTTVPPHATLSLTLPEGADQLVFRAVLLSTDGDWASQSASGTITWAGDCEGEAFCAYGTQLQPSVVGSEIITLGLIDLVLTAAGYPWAAVIVDSLVGATMNTGALCAGLSPGLPGAFTGATAGNYPISPSPADVLQFFEALAWPVFCECTPAVGPADPPVAPPPVVIVPPDPVSTPPPPVVLPPPPIITCSNSDICSTLNEVLRVALATNANVLEALRLLRNVQALPPPAQGYHRGRTFIGLDGEGSLTIASNSVGVVIELTAAPGRIGLIEDDRDTIWDCGWVNVGSADGYQPRQFINTTPMLIMPLASGMNRVSYSLTPDVVANITELIANT